VFSSGSQEGRLTPLAIFSCYKIILALLFAIIKKKTSSLIGLERVFSGDNNAILL
jgi:hypothetical protein